MYTCPECGSHNVRAICVMQCSPNINPRKWGQWGMLCDWRCVGGCGYRWTTNDAPGLIDGVLEGVR